MATIAFSNLKVLSVFFQINKNTMQPPPEQAAPLSCNVILQANSLYRERYLLLAEVIASFSGLFSSQRVGRRVMKRHYFISENLSDLKSIEKELEQRGITTLQMHVLSQRDADVANHKLHEVMCFMKQDLVHSTVLGAAIGVVAGLLLLSIVHIAGVAETAIGWTPFVYLSIVILGFCTWEGGLRGIQEPNHRFVRFQQLLQDGKHIFFVDVDGGEEKIMKQVVAQYPGLQSAGVERAGARWVVAWEQRCLNFIKTLP